MTSFLICYPDVPAAALTVTTSVLYDEDHPIENTFYGERHTFGCVADSDYANAMEIVYDLGFGNLRKVDHFILGVAAPLHQAHGVTRATLEGSNNGSSWTNLLGTVSGLSTRVFDGIDGRDIIFTPSYNDQVAAVSILSYRYFRVQFAATALNPFPVSKIYFGASFDMEREPDYFEPEITAEQDADTWRYPRGHVVMSKAFYPRQRFRLEWDGISDAKAGSFCTTILANPYRQHVFLYAATYKDPLFGSKLVHCRVVAEECSVTKEKEDWNTLVLVCEELI